jgi:hypothetical protein
LWRKELTSKISILQRDVSGRCLAMCLDVGQGRKIVFITVYFPCFENNADYFDELGQCLGFIESVLDNNTFEIVVLGDFNFPCVSTNAAFVKSMDLFNDHAIYECDKFIKDPQAFSYVHETLGHRSLIDHYFMSDTLMPLIDSMLIIDDAANLSYHIHNA